MPCLVSLMSCSQSSNIADVYPDLLQCWAVLKFRTHTVDVYPVLLHGWYTISWYIVELWSILLNYRQVSWNVVESQSESSATSPKISKSCRLAVTHHWKQESPPQSTAPGVLGWRITRFWLSVSFYLLSHFINNSRHLSLFTSVNSSNKRCSVDNSQVVLKN